MGREDSMVVKSVVGVWVPAEDWVGAFRWGGYGGGWALSYLNHRTLTGTVPSLISLEVVVAVGIRLIRSALVRCVDSSGSNPRASEIGFRNSLDGGSGAGGSAGGSGGAVHLKARDLALTAKAGIGVSGGYNGGAGGRIYLEAETSIGNLDSQQFGFQGW